MLRMSTEERQMPLAVEPNGSSSVAALLDAAARDGELFSNALLAHGALLFRGFDLADLDDFARFVSAFSGKDQLFGYAGGASPRSGLSQANPGVYSSTEYPSHVGLSLHNELSYADVYPQRLYFFCVTAPERGGETTIGDSRRILKNLPPALVERFRTRKIRYIRNLHSEKGYGYSWQEALGTDSRSEAEACCRRIGADFEWQPGGMLRMSQVRPATAVHPATGEEVWFNQADGFHPTALGADMYDEMMALCGSEEQFRLNVSYGDGTPIEVEALQAIRTLLIQETVPHRWRAGDILVIDNLLAAHGRMPFSGPRKIALAMT